MPIQSEREPPRAHRHRPRVEAHMELQDEFDKRPPGEIEVRFISHTSNHRKQPSEAAYTVNSSSTGIIDKSSVGHNVSIVGSDLQSAPSGSSVTSSPPFHLPYDPSKRPVAGAMVSSPTTLASSSSPGSPVLSVTSRYSSPRPNSFFSPTASSPTAQWTAQEDSPTRSIKSTDAIKSPCSKTSCDWDNSSSQLHFASSLRRSESVKTFKSAIRVSKSNTDNLSVNTLRKSQEVSQSTAGHMALSTRASTISASSSGCSASTGKRISDPIFQSASSGFYPASHNEHQAHPDTENLPRSAVTTTSASEQGAAGAGRKRLLSTAFEEPEPTAAENPSTPRHNQHVQVELKSKFSHSPSARQEGHVSTAFNKSMAMLKRSFGDGDMARPDLAELQMRSESPSLQNKPSRKILGFLNTNTMLRPESPFGSAQMYKRSSDASHSSHESKKGLNSSLRRKSKAKIRSGSKASSYGQHSQRAGPSAVDASHPNGDQNADQGPGVSSFPPLPDPFQLDTFPDPQYPIELQEGDFQYDEVPPCNRWKLARRRLPLPAEWRNQRTFSRATSSSQRSRATTHSSSIGSAPFAGESHTDQNQGKAHEADKSSPRKARSLRKLRLVPRNSPKRRPSRPPLVASAGQPDTDAHFFAPPQSDLSDLKRSATIRDSWVDIAEDIHIDGSSAVNGLPRNAPRGIIGQKKGLKGRRTWKLAKDNDQHAPPFANLSKDHAQPHMHDSFRGQHRFAIGERPPRLPSLALDTMTIISQNGPGYASDTSRGTVDSAQARRKSASKRPLMLPSSTELKSTDEQQQRLLQESRFARSQALQSESMQQRQIARPPARHRLHTKQDRCTFTDLPPVSSTASPQQTQSAPHMGGPAPCAAPKEPLPEKPCPKPTSSAQSKGNTLPVPKHRFSQRPVPHSALSSQTISPAPSRGSVEPDSGGDPTQLSMSTVGTSILFTDVDAALRQLLRREDTGEDAEGGAASPDTSIPSEQEMKLAAALARYICRRSTASEAQGRTPLTNRLLNVLQQNAEESGADVTAKSVKSKGCDVGNTSQATDLLSELVAQFKSTPAPSPGGSLVTRKNSVASHRSSRLLRTPERRHRFIGRPGSTQQSPSSYRSPGRRRVRYMSSREGSIRTNTYSQSIMSYCSTPVSSSADDLTSLLEGLLETSEGENEGGSGQEQQMQKQKQESAQVDTASQQGGSSTVNTPITSHTMQTIPETPIATTSKPRDGSTNANSEAVAAVLSLYQQDGTPVAHRVSRGGKRKEPDLQIRTTDMSPSSSASPQKPTSPVRRRNDSTRRTGHRALHSRRMSVDMEGRRFRVRDSQDYVVESRQMDYSDNAPLPGEGVTSSTPTSSPWATFPSSFQNEPRNDSRNTRRDVGTSGQHKSPLKPSRFDMIVASMHAPTMPTSTAHPIFDKSQSRDLMRPERYIVEDGQLPPTPPLTIDRLGVPRGHNETLLTPTTQMEAAGDRLRTSTNQKTLSPPGSTDKYLPFPLIDSSRPTPVTTPREPVFQPKQLLFSPVPALVITDADLEAKCQSALLLSSPLNADDPFGGGKAPPLSSSSSTSALMWNKKKGKGKHSIDSMENYETAPNSESEDANMGPVQGGSDLRVDETLPCSQRPQWDDRYGR
ncbi:unnamed protein product [Sympodiomycopsis kandeliae]